MLCPQESFGFKSIETWIYQLKNLIDQKKNSLVGQGPYLIYYQSKKDIKIHH